MSMQSASPSERRARAAKRFHVPLAFSRVMRSMWMTYFLRYTLVTLPLAVLVGAPGHDDLVVLADRHRADL